MAAPPARGGGLRSRMQKRWGTDTRAPVTRNMNLKPFFTFYGGKWRAAPHYPPPEFATVIEPFAGAAGYSVRHHERRVTLIERDPLIAATWRYLIRSSPQEILALPDIAVGQTTDDLPICPEARLLVGWWVNGGSATPKKSLGQWARRMRTGEAGTKGGMLVWGQRVRERLASQVDAIKHWRIAEGDWSTAPDIEATWFIDPPYIDAGKYYRFGPDRIDFAALAEWCRSRRGQVIVCENVGATWLPFRPWRKIKASERAGGRPFSDEAIWP